MEKNLTFFFCLKGTDNSIINSSPDSSWELLYQRIVCFTGISANHYEEANKMFTTVQKCLPDKKVIVFDLGLRESQRKNLTERKNLELRHFPFDAYKNLSHVKNLQSYAFKGIMVKMIALEYPDSVIFYGDASVRMISCNISSVLNHLRKFPIFSGAPNHFKAIAFTHDGMINYLKFPKERKDMAAVPTIQSGCYLLLVNNETRHKIVDPWEDCSLHKECIAPNGCKTWPCHFTTEHDGHYVGCHRYDQSALNLILAREYGLDYFSRAVDRNISKLVFKIERHP